MQVFPELATDLQTLCWATYFLFSCALAEPGAYFQRTWGARDLLLVVAALTLLTLYVGVNCWLGDRPKLSQELPTAKVRAERMSDCQVLRPVAHATALDVTCMHSHSVKRPSLRWERAHRPHAPVWHLLR
jgi:hypothetical protein